MNSTVTTLPKRFLRLVLGSAVWISSPQLMQETSVFAKGETEALRLKSSDLFEMIKQYPRLKTVLEQFALAMSTKMRDLPE